MFKALVVFCAAVVLGVAVSPPPPRVREPSSVSAFLAARPLETDRHVLLMHVDGFQTHVFQAMLQLNQLPNFRFLIENGAANYAVSTVDKSETMKVIPSVLSSKVDTRLTAWWQFDRQTMGFRNFWIDPAEVVNYALGMDFPLYPTIIDAVAREGHGDRDIVAGFNLYRRGVPAKNYSRIYVEGYDSVSSHRYYRQAFATTHELIHLLKSQAQARTYPKLILSLIAPIDEMIHLNGVTKNGETRSEYCFSRSKKGIEPADDVMDELAKSADPGEQRGFTRITRGWSLTGRIDEICIKAPLVDLRQPNGQVTREHVYPEVALAAIVADINVGRLIQALREIRLNGNVASLQPTSVGLSAYERGRRLESSAFEKTLFLIYGDHGMTNTFHLMSKPLGYEAERVNRARGSYIEPFTQILSTRFSLRAYTDGKWFGPANAKLVIDYSHLPPEIAEPALSRDWQSPALRKVVADAGASANGLFTTLVDVLKQTAREKYWYLGYLRRYLVDPKVDKAAAGGHDMAIGILRNAVLRGHGDYLSAARDHAVDYYNKHVGMVYGGGALNNAEIFLPHTSKGQADWATRPSQQEVFAAFNGQFLKMIASTPGVGVIYSRRENAAFLSDGPVPDLIHIDVFDTVLNHGLILVKRDARTHEQVFAYKKLSERDPLQYEQIAGHWGTYQEWNDLSVQHHTFYQNAVAGPAAYLASSSAAVGDVTIMHAPGWNFGENLGGHGGIEAEEKLMSLIAFGPGVTARSHLMSKCAYETNAATGEVHAGSRLHAPTILDVAPTAMAHLGFASKDGIGELTRFSRGAFPQYLNRWRASQMKTCAQQGLLVVESQLQKLGYAIPPASAQKASGVLAQLCRELETQDLPRLPDYSKTKEDGCLLSIGSTSADN